MNTRISVLDNYRNGKVGDFLRGTISDGADLSFVSAYWTIFAWDELRAELDKIKHLRFLFGEPAFIKELAPDGVHPREYKFTDDKLDIPPDKQIEQKRIARACADWIKEKADIKSMVKPNFLHGKMYYIKPSNGRDDAIVGSSNFTTHGLGLSHGTDKNIELNIVIRDDRDREELLEWFNALWNDNTGLVRDVKAEVLEYLNQLYCDNSPQFIYYKTLYHIFGKYLAEQSKINFDDRKTLYESAIWNTLYDFQKDGVKGVINKIEKYNGCIIADSVGLGKTYEALAVIKYYELQNAKVLVLCPRKLSGNWTLYQASKMKDTNPLAQDNFRYNVLYHTDMGRIKGKSDADGIEFENFNWNLFDLVVIDESHNFRANASVSRNAEQKEIDGDIRLNRAAWLLEKVIKAGFKTRVLLLSATPVNNTLRDLRNQITLITGGKDDAFAAECGIKSYSETLKQAQNVFTRWADPKNSERRTKDLLQRLDAALFKLLDEITIARSRKHIVQYYDINKVGTFPKREKPISIFPAIDTQGKFPSYDFINKMIMTYKLSIFNPSKYVKDDKKSLYKNKTGGKKQFDQLTREHFLIGMMKVNYLKRLESSIESFEISLNRTVENIESLRNKIHMFQEKHTSTKLDAVDLFNDDNINGDEYEDDAAAVALEMLESFKVGKKLQFDMSDLKLDDWLKDLKEDRDALTSLLGNAASVTPDRDAKLQELKKLITAKVNQPFNGTNKKVLIFTAFSDTAQYLYDNITTWAKDTLGLESALVFGSGSRTTFGKNDYDHILINFAPRAKNRANLKGQETEREIDILIATDCISEGQNLQDCDYLINYDIHWNPVRIVQRFGRIDRINSNNDTIRLVNFWPTADLDAYINLKTRVESRMALADISATTEDNILATDKLDDLITDDLKYRDAQLKRLQNEVLDIEDMDETISLTDFTLDDFRVELSNYITNNKQKLANSPKGLYALVPPDTNNDIIKPGVIFCLEQKRFDDDNTKVNQLNPYYLVYIRDDGTVRYTYTNSKQILEIYRLLCYEKNAPIEKLCRLFDRETNDGKDVSKYTELLKKCAEQTVATFRKKSAVNLTSSRGGLLIPDAKAVSAMEDFELVTWLIIKEENNGNS